MKYIWWKWYSVQYQCTHPWVAQGATGCYKMRVNHVLLLLLAPLDLTCGRFSTDVFNNILHQHHQTRVHRLKWWCSIHHEGFQTLVESAEAAQVTRGSQSPNITLIFFSNIHHPSCLVLSILLFLYKNKVKYTDLCHVTTFHSVSTHHEDRMSLFNG